MTRRELLASALLAPLIQIRTGFAQGAADLTALTIAQALPRLRAREITPLQLADAYLARIDALNGDLNAYVTVTRDLARRTARDLSEARRGPLPALYGIPIAHKDLLETRGVRTTGGSLLFEDHLPVANAVLVQRLESAGAVLLGKTNTHELGGGVTTINPFFGTTRNPAARDRVAGGSSGGSAAAVAARLCAAATGSDTGGSVRIPAAFCGVVGFKPTHGRIGTQGVLGGSPTFDHVGFLTRTVEDAELLFRAATGTGASPDTAAAARTPLRVGVARHYFFDGLDPAVASAMDAAIARLPGTRVDVRVPIDAATMARIFDPVLIFELWGRWGAYWRTSPAGFSKEFAAFFATGRPSVIEYETGLAALRAWQAEVDRLFDTVDVIITPTVPVTAPPIAGPIDGMTILRNTWPFNAAGTPAITIPLPAAPLPVGLQLVARRSHDDKLLQIAAAIRVTP